MIDVENTHIKDENDIIFEEMYCKFDGILRNIAKRYHIPPQDAEDLIQETYISYYLNYNFDWNDMRKKAILVKILKNRCVDYFRGIRNDYGLEDVNAMRICNEYDNPEYKIIEKESDREFRREIYKLKREYQDIILLHGLQEKDTDTICHQLAINKNTYYLRLYRIKKCLIAISVKRGKIKITLIFL